MAKGRVELINQYILNMRAFIHMIKRAKHIKAVTEPVYDMIHDCYFYNTKENTNKTELNRQSTTLTFISLSFGKF